MKAYKYTINGNKYEVTIGDIVDNIATVDVNGESYQVEMEADPEPEKKKVVVRPREAATPISTSPDSATPINTGNALKAPLPGVVIEICVAVGDEVKAGDVLVVLEAMKMANNLEAEKAGKVTAILVQQGASVMEDTPLVVVE